MSIEITPALLSDLRQKAEAYELKEWYVGDYRQKKAEGCNLKEWYVGDLLVLAGFGYNMTSVAQTLDPQNAEYIAAASPAVVLALVAEIERLKDRLDALECPDCGHLPKFCMCDVQLEASNADQA